MLLLTQAAASEEIDRAIKYGGLLTKAVQGKDRVKLKKLTEYKQIKTFLSQHKCSGMKYKGYIVGDNQDKYLYLVASKSKNIIIGRHFKAPIKGTDIIYNEFESSTNSCLNLGTPPKDTQAVYATHLKPYPNEFHILQSNLSGVALYVGTPSENYAIENGEVRVLEQ